MTEKVKVRPFLIGIVDGGLTNEIIKQLEKHLEGYPICTISMSNYYKDIIGENYIKPQCIDLDLLLSDLAKIRNQEVCEIPIFDFQNKKRSREIKKIESCQIIIVEGLFCFYNHKIRNLMDLKIFIDTENDIRLARTISKGIHEGTKLIDIIEYFHKTIKPAYNNFISPTKRYADMILPNATGHATAVKIITNYLKLLLDKVSNNESGNIFSFLNGIIDPKYIFFQDKLIVNNEQLTIDFLKNVFEDFITKKHDEEFIDEIQQKLLDIIQALTVDYFRKNSKFSENLPTIDMLLFDDSDDVKKINFEDKNIVFFYKTSILTENDIKIPQYILSQHKDCNIIISSIFLAPKFAHFLTSNQINSIVFITLYFNEFFIKYDEIIKKDKTVFNEKVLEKKFKKSVDDLYNYSS
jgi:uridine kinase